VDIDWRLDYSIRSKHGGRNNIPMYFVNLKVKERGLLRNIEMIASLEEMQDLLASVRPNLSSCVCLTLFLCLSLSLSLSLTLFLCPSLSLFLSALSLSVCLSVSLSVSLSLSLCSLSVCLSVSVSLCILPYRFLGKRCCETSRER
jgi:hypothetical protein